MPAFGGWYKSSLLLRRPNVMPFEGSKQTRMSTLTSKFSRDCIEWWKRKTWQCDHYTFRYVRMCLVAIIQRYTDRWIKQLILNTPFHNACGFHHSYTKTSTESKVFHIGDIWEFPVRLCSNSIFAWWRNQTRNRDLITSTSSWGHERQQHYLPSYLGLSASMYFLYPGLLGQP